MIIGLVGKPNVGKSTFFKAATLVDVDIASYPFTTIEANQGIGFVRVKCPEKELNLKCNPQHGFCIKGERFVPIKLVDVAGLVPGASEGKGKGNQFLDDLREADCLIHILDASGKTDEEGNMVENYDITKDVEFLENEIVMWIKQILTKNWITISRKGKSEGKLSSVVAEQLSGLKISEDNVKDVMRDLDLKEKGEWTDEQILEFAREIRKKSKPIIIAANKVDIEGADENIKKLKEKFSEILIVPCSADSELALKEASESGLIEYVPGDEDFKVDEDKVSEKQKKALERIKKVLKKYKETGVQKCLNEAVFSFLNYIVVYPVENEKHFADKKGNVLPDVHVLPKGSTALDLAYAIHSDIGKNFIAAVDCRTGRRLAKDAALKNNDIVKIMVK